jgi:hypothetical protein
MPKAHTQSSSAHKAPAHPAASAGSTPAAIDPARLALIANLRGSSKFRKVLTDPQLGAEFAAVAVFGTFSETRDWLAARGIEISDRGVSEGCRSLKDAALDLARETEALEVLDKDMNRRGTSMAKATQKKIVVAVSKFMHGAAAPETDRGKQLILGAGAIINDAVRTEIQERQGDQKINLKREDVATTRAKLDLELSKYRDAVAARKAAIQKEIGAAKRKGGLSKETIEKIEQELNLL